jgi:hypothetical protein
MLIDDFSTGTVSLVLASPGNAISQNADWLAMHRERKLSANLGALLGDNQWLCRIRYRGP